MRGSAQRGGLSPAPDSRITVAGAGLPNFRGWRRTPKFPRPSPGSQFTPGASHPVFHAPGAFRSIAVKSNSGV